MDEIFAVEVEGELGELDYSLFKEFDDAKDHFGGLVAESTGKVTWLSDTSVEVHTELGIKFIQITNKEVQ